MTYDIGPPMSYDFHAGRWKLVSLMTITKCTTTLSSARPLLRTPHGMGAANNMHSASTIAAFKHVSQVQLSMPLLCFVEVMLLQQTIL